MTEQKVISRQTGVEDNQYKWGFDFDIESDLAPKGLNEGIVRFISAKKEEPEWMLDWRLKAFKHWQNQGDDAAPKWAKWYLKISISKTSFTTLLLKVRMTDRVAWMKSILSYCKHLIS